MKVSIPTRDENGLDGIVEQHFGKAPTYTIIDTETNQVTVIPNTSEHMGGIGLRIPSSKWCGHYALCRAWVQSR